MSVEAPLWVLLAASALGGAALTGLVTLATRLLDLRHRHDETRRDQYVAMLLALDEYFQSMAEAADQYNYMLEFESSGGPPNEKEAAEAARALAEKAREDAR